MSMTDEEHKEKERLIADDLASISNRVRHAFNQGYELGRKSVRENARLKEAIGKIREDIKALRIWHEEPLIDVIDINRVIEIIDKHTEGLL